MPHTENKNKQRGFVASLNTLLILVFMLTIALSMGVVMLDRQKISTNTVLATQSYYTAQAGVEDSLLRLKTNPQMTPLTYNLAIGNSSTTVTIPAILGGSRSVTSQGTNNNLIKTTQVVYSIDSQDVAFHYGAQVGAGGLSLGSNSTVQGNVFADGNITGNGTITGDVIVAENGHSIKDASVGGNVLAYSCLSPASVSGNLTYVTGGSHTCSVSGSTTSQSASIPNQSLPISDQQITDWKDETATGTAKSAYTIASNATATENTAVVITGNMSVGSNATWNLMGPTKIIGNLTIGSNATINMSGTLYVTGAIGFGNNSITQLASSYASLSGMVISDGIITTNSNSVLRGSGQAGSYILIISTNVSSSAIGVGNNATGAVFYTSAGGISINNNATVREATGYKITLGSNAILTYESGLADLNFTSGPGGSWKVTSWQEQ